MEENGQLLLKNIASKLEKVTGEVLQSQGFNQETEKLLILLELVKEQVPNEDSHS